MTSLALVARLRLPLDHLETTYLICMNCRCSELKYQVGGEGEELCVTESAIERFRSRIKEINHTKTDKSDLHEEY